MSTLILRSTCLGLLVCIGAAGCQTSHAWTDTSSNLTPATPTRIDRLLPGQGLRMNQSIASDNRQFKLIMQGDGNLVLYKPDLRAAWASNTYHANSGSPSLFMQADGNLVMYDQTGKPMWASNTWGNPGAILVVKDDGNAVIQDSSGHVLWATNNSAG